MKHSKTFVKDFQLSQGRLCYLRKIKNHDLVSGRRTIRKIDYEPIRPPSYVYDYQKYQYSDEEEKRRGKILSLYYLFDSVLLLLAMIYHKRMQTLKLQKNLREIRQKKEEVSNSEFYPTFIVP